MAERELVVGDVLWYVPTDRRWNKPRSVTVTKVGSVWAEISDRLRINKRTFQADGGQYQSPGRCYWSEADWAGITERTRAWSQLKEAFGHGGPPDGVTLEAIHEAAALLKLTIPSTSQETAK